MVLVLVTLQGLSVGQIAGLQLVNFFQDFSETQDVNGINYAVLPRAPDTSVPLLVFNPDVSFGNGSQTFTGPAFLSSSVIPYVQQDTYNTRVSWAASGLK